MEITTQDQLLTPEEVQTLVNMQPKNTKKRLDINVPEATWTQMIYSEVEFLVNNWGGKFEGSEDLKSKCAVIANVVVNRGLKNGILLVGSVGNGKSTLMKALQKSFCLLVNHGYLNYGEGLRIVSAKDIHSNEKSEEFNRALRYEPFLGIDDLGAEPREEMIYGRVTTPIVDLLEYRYSRQLFTIVTSNLNSEERKLKYGTRLCDRFNEMLIKMVFTNDSFR